ncbi:MAG: hypothetical protein ACLQBY_02635 [Solirubrobacteraceae bacterium]
MGFSTRAPLLAKATVALWSACVALALAAGTTALAASVIHFQPESLPALEGQLGHHEVHALTFHPGTGAGHIHVSLNDGRHMTVPYATAEQAQLVALAGKDGTTVAIAAAKPKAAKAPVHHKLRYIAAGILVVVIVVVAAVLLIDRRRKLGEAGGDRAAESAPLPSSPGDPT